MPAKEDNCEEQVDELAYSFLNLAIIDVSRRKLFACEATKKLVAHGLYSFARHASVLLEITFGSTPRHWAFVGERQPWDLGRFLKTVTFFNKPPSPVEVLQGLMQQPLKVVGGLSSPDTEVKKSVILPLLGVPDSAAPAAGPAAAATTPAATGSGVVLVTGATGGVGQRVVRYLLDRGVRVRALVRDVAKAKESLSKLDCSKGGSLELVAADITQKQTLLPEMFQGVRAVISCTAVKVAAEGDSPSRERYLQGIKFFNPSIEGDSPNTVEYKGIQNLLDAVKPCLGVREGQYLLGLDSPGSDATAWGALDDVVMGGCSESGLMVQRGAGEDGGDAFVFRGVVTTANNGGFASVRSKNFEPILDLSPYEGLAIRLKGNGMRLKCTIRSDTNWDSLSYCRSFDTQAGEWQTALLPFSEFQPVFRASTVKNGPRFDPSKVASVQLMLSKFEYDGELNPSFQPGPFEVPVSYIKAVLPQGEGARFVHVSSAGVTRPNRPGIDVDAEPPAVKLNDQLDGILTWKLAGEDAIRSSGMTFAIVRPCALTEEPSGAELLFDQGDTIKGKISREDVAELCLELLSRPSGRDRTFEVKSTVPFSQPWEVDPANPPPPRDWQKLLEDADLQAGVTGKTIDGVYTGKKPESAAVSDAVSV